MPCPKARSYSRSSVLVSLDSELHSVEKVRSFTPFRLRYPGLSGFFYNLGRQLGRKAVPAARKSKWIWTGVTGGEEEALRAEVALGAEMAEELRSTVDLLQDAELQGVLDEICHRLSERIRDKRRTFQCEVFRDVLPNAMTLPGGWIFLSDGLARGCGGRDGELAFCIAHEIAHIVLRHTWDRMISDAALKIAAAATSRIGPIGGWVRSQGIALLRSAHSSDCESAADEMGFRLCRAAGFDPDGAFAVLRRWQASTDAGINLGPYFASHPPTVHRIARLNKLNQHRA